MESYPLVIKFIKTHIRKRNINDYESYINPIDQDYETEDDIFKDYIYKLNTHQFNLVKRTQYGNGCDFKHQNIGYGGNICFIPSNSCCFVKCIFFLTGGNYKQQH